MPRKSEKEVDHEDQSEESENQPKDLPADEMSAIDPYVVLGIEKSATADEIKRAYRMTALKHHPDKAPADLKEEATTKFQELAFAYAVLSDPVRRKRYDVTGSTAESLDSEHFSWSDFYKEQFRDVITPDAIERLETIYKKSPEERKDLLVAFEEHKGNMSAVFETVMLSDPLEDEERFRAIIDEAIEKNEVTAWKAYLGETGKAKEERKKQARSEAKEAEEMAKELGVHDTFYGDGKRKRQGTGEDALAALIQQRRADKGKSFMDALESKYIGQQKSKKGRGKKRVFDEDEEDDADMPSEEAFQATQAKLKKAKAKADGEKAGGSRKLKRSRAIDEDDGDDADMLSEEALQASQAKLKKANASKKNGEKAGGSRRSKR